MPLDGQFMDNVILQIKKRADGFQVREPVLPLFGGLKETNQILELQITQEYTSQRSIYAILFHSGKKCLILTHILKERFDSKKNNCREALSAEAWRNCGGIKYRQRPELDRARACPGEPLRVRVPGIRPDKVPKKSLKNGCALHSHRILMLAKTISDILLKSWRTYENYTSPLGIGWMVSPDHHYGPNVDGYEYSHWGTYHPCRLFRHRC